MKKTKVTAILLILMFALTFIAPATFASNLNDLTEHWAEVSVKGLIDKGIISGYPDGSFKPEAK